MKRTTKTMLLWTVAMVALVAYEAVSFGRFRREHVRVFHSNVEMLLVPALIAVALVGVFVNSRNSRNRP